MTDDLLAYSRQDDEAIRHRGFRRDARDLGIGAMTDAHMKSFYDQMVRAGVVKAGLDYSKAYTTQFVNKGVGKELRPK